MNELAFGWADPGSLAVELCKPLRQVSVEFIVPNSGPRFFTLWRMDKTGLRLYTEMHEVAERREVGVLNLEHVFAPKPGELTSDVMPAFQGEIIASKLVIHESGTAAESGIVLATPAGDELVIVAGAYPYSLAVRGAFSLPIVFSPEYQIDRYLRVPIV